MEPEHFPCSDEPLYTLFMEHGLFLYKKNQLILMRGPEDILKLRREDKKYLYTQLKWVSCPLESRENIEYIINNTGAPLPPEGYIGKS